MSLRMRDPDQISATRCEPRRGDRGMAVPQDAQSEHWCVAPGGRAKGVSDGEASVEGAKRRSPASRGGPHVNQIGVDPGKHGALALIRNDGAFVVTPMPLVKALVEENGRRLMRVCDCPA